MIAHKKEFALGLTLFIVFWIVFTIGMSPVFDGKNMLNLTDDLFNSVSKSSSDYMEESMEEAEAHKGTDVTFTTKGEDSDQTTRIAALLEDNGVTAAVKDDKVEVTGDLGVLLTGAVADSEVMFANEGEAIAAKYGYAEKNVMYDWWVALDEAQRDLTRNDAFDDSKVVSEIMEKAVEPSYNYYGIDAESPRDKAFLITMSLIGYIVYTVWYGFALLFMFEGWGLKLEH